MASSSASLMISFIRLSSSSSSNSTKLSSPCCCCIINIICSCSLLAFIALISYESPTRWRTMFGTIDLTIGWFALPTLIGLSPMTYPPSWHARSAPFCVPNSTKVNQDGCTYVFPAPTTGSTLRRGAMHVTFPTLWKKSNSWSSVSSGCRLPTYTVRRVSSLHAILARITCLAYAGCPFGGSCTSGCRGSMSRLDGMPATCVLRLCKDCRMGSELTPTPPDIMGAFFMSSSSSSGLVPMIFRATSAGFVRSAALSGRPGILSTTARSKYSPVLPPASSYKCLKWSACSTTLVALSIFPNAMCWKASSMGFHLPSLEAASIS
mmetsp:Transcript_29293/g.57053  ORF Transcript_29293/g.57053 Transcript_29293/m.57053 type:complete len:321 (+) Transcript_29293:771-1733(+)